MDMRVPRPNSQPHQRGTNAATYTATGALTPGTQLSTPPMGYERGQTPRPSCPHNSTPEAGVQSTSGGVRDLPPRAQIRRQHIHHASADAQKVYGPRVDVT